MEQPTDVPNAVDLLESRGRRSAESIITVHQGMPGIGRFFFSDAGNA